MLHAQCLPSPDPIQIKSLCKNPTSYKAIEVERLPPPMAVPLLLNGMRLGLVRWMEVRRGFGSMCCIGPRLFEA